MSDTEIPGFEVHTIVRTRANGIAGTVAAGNETIALTGERR